MKRSIWIYGLALGALIAVMRYVEYQFLVRDHAIEIFAGILGLVFTVLGIWIGLKLTRKKTEIVVVEKEIHIEKHSEPFSINESGIEKLGISKREYEVLELMAKGMSNQEIADALFVSLNTIKTHSSRLFEKLDVNRRTQAIQKAKEMRLIS